MVQSCAYRLEHGTTCGRSIPSHLGTWCHLSATPTILKTQRRDLAPLKRTLTSKREAPAWSLGTSTLGSGLFAIPGFRQWCVILGACLEVGHSPRIGAVLWRLAVLIYEALGWSGSWGIRNSSITTEPSGASCLARWLYVHLQVGRRATLQDAGVCPSSANCLLIGGHAWPLRPSRYRVTCFIRLTEA